MLDHKKAKEIKSKSLGRKLQSFLSTHTRTRRVGRTRTQLHTQTLHRHGQVTARNGAEVESFIDEMFGQLTAGHCPAGLRHRPTSIGLCGCGLFFGCCVYY